jgi:NADPH-dependent ferric siderophore reductase
VLGGEGLAGFTPRASSPTTTWKLQFPPRARPYGVPFDAERSRALPREQQPVLRTYSVRDWDADRGGHLDFVVHGDTGSPGPWGGKRAA